MRTLLLLPACTLLPPLSLQAQQNKLLVRPPDQIAAKRGATVTQALDISVLNGFHVNSDKPKDEFLIPLKLTWTGGPLEQEAITYPKPEEITVGNQRTTVFSGKFQVQTKFLVPANAPKGNSAMTGKLRYQACNNEMCFRPLTVDLHVPVAVE